MASTRNNNTPGDYCLQQRSYRTALGYDLYKYKRVSPDTRFPCFGINVHPKHSINFMILSIYQMF